MSNPKQCGKCGEPHAPNKCQGHRKYDGRQCTNDPKHGMRVCRMHGGSSPGAAAKAAEVVLERRARALLPAEFAQHADPLGEALRTLSEAVSFRDALRDLVGEVRAIRYKDDKGGEQLRSEIAVYERALDRVGRMCTDLIRLGIEDRMTRVAELQAVAIVDAIREVCNRHQVPALVVSEIGERIGALT